MSHATTAARALRGERATARAVTADTARKLIRAGDAPVGMKVSGSLAFVDDEKLTELPEGLTVATLKLSNCPALRRLPKRLQVRRLDLSGRWNPERLLAGVSCYELDLKQTAVTSLPGDLHVSYRIDLEGCTGLQSLPGGLKVGSLILRDCTGLEALPEGLDVYFLDISGCTGISQWPRRGSLQVGRLTARGCAQLRSLPKWVTRLAQLDLRDCSNLRELPEGLVVTSWMDVAGTSIRSLPSSMKGMQLRWRGVSVDERVAFRPELITADEILAEGNVERRRVLLERMGYDTFLAHANAKTLDEDRDPGGVRRLLRVPMTGDEDLVCVSVICPSTGRQYVLRVPPTMTTCHQAVAWVAGFDNADDYRPLAET
jgi:hypothetical protein